MTTTTLKRLFIIGLLCLINTFGYAQLNKKSNFTFYLSGDKALYGTIETHYDDYLLIKAEPGSLINKENGMTGSYLVRKMDLLRYSSGDSNPRDFKDHQQSYNTLGKARRFIPQNTLMRRGGDKQLTSVILAVAAIFTPIIFNNTSGRTTSYIIGGVGLGFNIWGFFELTQAGKLSVAKRYKAKR